MIWLELKFIYFVFSPIFILNVENTQTAKENGKSVPSQRLMHYSDCYHGM